MQKNVLEDFVYMFVMDINLSSAPLVCNILFLYFLVLE